MLDFHHSNKHILLKLRNRGSESTHALLGLELGCKDKRQATLARTTTLAGGSTTIHQAWLPGSCTHCAQIFPGSAARLLIAASHERTRASTSGNMPVLLRSSEQGTASCTIYPINQQYAGSLFEEWLLISSWAWPCDNGTCPRIWI